MERYCTRNSMPCRKGIPRVNILVPRIPLIHAFCLQLTSTFCFINSQTMEIQALSPETIQDTVSIPPDSIPADQIDSTFSTCIGNPHPQTRPLLTLLQRDPVILTTAPQISYPLLYSPASSPSQTSSSPQPPTSRPPPRQSAAQAIS